MNLVGKDRAQVRDSGGHSSCQSSASGRTQCAGSRYSSPICRWLAKPVYNISTAAGLLVALRRILSSATIGRLFWSRGCRHPQSCAVPTNCAGTEPEELTMIQPDPTSTSLTEKADAAFEQASRKVIERARQTNTPIVIWKDGRVEQIPNGQSIASCDPTASKQT